MNLQKAIEVLENIIATARYSDYLDDHEAIRLGIEALKRVKERREPARIITRHLLPGETKE